MFNNEHMADVHFVVGSPGATQKVPAHKVSLKSLRHLQVSFRFCRSVETGHVGQKRTPR